MATNVKHRHIKDNSKDVFDRNSKSEVVVRTIETTKNVNTLSQEITTVGTSSVALTFPIGATSFSIFHQHATAKVYFGDSDVSTSGYPYLEQNDSLSLDVKDSIELYAISDTAGVEVFILGEVKE